MVVKLLDKVGKMNFSGGKIPENKYLTYCAGKTNYDGGSTNNYTSDCDCIDCGDCDCDDCPV